ncbi:MAG: HAD-IIB family hydrolase [Propionibacteriaceae bacterium]|nr:HAD-IIB family hydrolase [Propionibacteriaceae bacterium]
MTIRLVAFDLDDTLALSKTAIEPSMAAALARLLKVCDVAIISGGAWPQFNKQVLAKLPPEADLSRLHILPTCGMRYCRFEDGQWNDIYQHFLTDEEKAAAIASVTKRAKELGAWEPDAKVAGERIEDRGSQITYSALGQLASPANKRAWDPTGARRHALRDAVAADLPSLSVGAGGSTSIDITRRGVDKAFGLKSLLDETGIPLSDVVFVGDRTEPGGNDYPVVELGVETITVTDWRNTLDVINDFCEQLEVR